MHRLNRQIRFSVNPFLEQTPRGSNSFASKPAGEGLAVFLSLWVELCSDLDPDTGFVVNVAEIDTIIRRYGIPVIAGRITERFRRGAHTSLTDLTEILEDAWAAIEDRFDEVTLHSLALDLNPYRKISIISEDAEMIYFTEKFDFAASHQLWNTKFSDEQNFQHFGKCANPSGHGHNYIIEVTVEKPAASPEFSIADYEKVVTDEFIAKVDHKNLNSDVDRFAELNPTVENIAVYAWDCLKDKFATARLAHVKVWESDRTYCKYSGPV
ncbi:6-pyruvoyl tetrahydropterin synthase/QueD family protein [Anaerohalosphaera lusitana]|uniref:6-carboxy-5,6,7,8-tetrahydropterin synthase n=1 Tax=Anaerohalosphaera lusitana TaxID=1936003 RepID=A0A1U9NJK6_9BACT|nr:6-carboxytetrahydropterin synthase [Anaerohalosphaera lusitana]AQT67760.1 6-pyruvoyl tetrahydropterin synthase/QueD family protein [Anaerohalosphaera lusitana]